MTSSEPCYYTRAEIIYSCYFYYISLNQLNNGQNINELDQVPN